MDEERVRVRSTAGLNRRHLLRRAEIADVENADAAEALRARARRGSLRAAVDASAVLLHRQEEQVAIDGDVALSTRAHHRCHKARAPGPLDVEDVEPVEAANEQV